MNLSKAKTILIIAFLTLNLFLGYHLWLTPQYLRAGGGLTGDEVDYARNLLQSAGFEVLTAIPRQIPRLSLLHVARLPEDINSWPTRFWGEDVQGQVLPDTGDTLYQKGSETLIVSSSGMAVFRRSSAMRVTGVEDPRQMVERFLRERGIWHDDLKFDFVAPLEGNVAYYRYLQAYQGFPVFTDRVEIQVQEGYVSEAIIYSLTPLGFSGKEITVISAAEAIATLVQQHPAQKDNRIVDIALGYYSQEYDAERWEIAPAWRFAFSNGTVFYVNAFTAEAEPVDL